MKYHVILLFVSLLFIVGGCSKEVVIKSTPKTTEQVYKESIVDAMVAEKSEICSTLVAIRPDNSYLNWSSGYVLVVTWTRFNSSYPAGDTITLKWGESWVTAVPQMKDWFKTHTVAKENKVDRVKQLLGLPASSQNTYFVEMWVKPEDMFRPAYDNEIDDNTSDNSFRTNTSQDYITWFNNFIISAYFPPTATTVKYPWTRLGYTYDWGGTDSKIGLSEFVVKKNSKVIVKSVTATDEYLK